MTKSVICKGCGIEYQADNREINRGNAKYCSLSCHAKYRPITMKEYTHTCLYCDKEFIAKHRQAKYCCTKCKRDYQAKSRKLDTNYSMKTWIRLLSDIPCEICDWKESSRDVHHISPIAKGGKDELKNLIVLCPNHHRMIHRGLISKETINQALQKRANSSHPVIGHA